VCADANRTDLKFLEMLDRRKAGAVGLSEKQIPLVWIPKEAIDRGLEFVIPGFV
jgi:hypothetical protein